MKVGGGVGVEVVGGEDGGAEEVMGGCVGREWGLGGGEVECEGVGC